MLLSAGSELRSKVTFTLPARVAVRLVLSVASVPRTRPLVTVSATRVEALKPAQENWQVKGGGGAGLAELVDRLGNRFGFGRIARPGPRQSWLPERAVEDAAPFSSSGATEWPAGRERPLRLLPVPEPVDAMALVPDDPPMQFTRQGKSYRVKAADASAYRPKKVG